jgi:hypothetical protein
MKAQRWVLNLAKYDLASELSAAHVNAGEEEELLDIRPKLLLFHN